MLVVEDSFAVADALKWELASFGASKVALAANVEQAMRLLDAAEVDAALLDVNLAGESVLPVAERLEECGVPFVFVTGYSDTDMLDGRFTEVKCYQKPISAGQIVPDLTSMIAAASGG